MIGLDTSHCPAFTKSLNGPDAGREFNGYTMAAAYPKGTELIQERIERIPEYTEKVREYGVEIVDSIDALIDAVDVVMLTCVDGNPHLKQALPVLKAGKPMFIDKPMAASLRDVMIIFKLAEHYGVPVFSSSSLRYIEGMDKVHGGEYGKILGAEAFSPAYLEEHHPDLAWYGIHGIEILFAAMGTGCEEVVRVFHEDSDLVVGTWEGNRIGTFRGLRTGKRGYGGKVFGEEAIAELGPYEGYEPLLRVITEFFETGEVPVNKQETIEMFAFIEAADISKREGGVPVGLEPVMAAAEKASDTWIEEYLSS